MNNSVNKKNIIKIIYLLYMISIVLGGIPLIIGFIMAIFSKEGADSIENSHFKNQMSLFLKIAIVGIIGVFTTPIFIGFVILFVLCIWTIYKSFKGISLLDQNQPIVKK